jgi:hypothetical protein
MTTSGTTTFNLTQDDIIVTAFDHVGGEDTSGYDLKRGREAVNRLLIDLQNRTVSIWKLNSRTLSLTNGTSSYTLPSGVDGVLDAVVQDTSLTDTTLGRLSLIDYGRISNKAQGGRPSQYVVQRNLDTVNLKVWPVPDSDDFTVTYWAIERIEDSGGFGNTLDLSYRFLPAFIFGLAYYLSFGRPGIDKDYRVLLKQEYEEHLLRAMEDYRERVSWRVKPVINRPRV